MAGRPGPAPVATAAIYNEDTAFIYALVPTTLNLTYFLYLIDFYSFEKRQYEFKFSAQLVLA